MPGSKVCPIFFACKANVILVLIAQPYIFPLSPFIPDGISMEIIFCFDLLIFDIVFLKRPEIFLFIPVPNKQSIITDFFLFLASEYFDV